MESTKETSVTENDNIKEKSDSVPESTTQSVLETEILSSGSESSDFDREYACDICEKSFSGLKPLKQHQRSGKHLKALRKLKLKKEIDDEDHDDDSSDEDFSFDRSKIYAECEFCCKEFNGPESYRLHMKSKRHKKKVANCKILEKAKEDGKINKDRLKEIMKVNSGPLKASVVSDSSESDEDTHSEVFECKNCEKVFSGLEPFRDHMSSKTHRKVLRQKEMIQNLTSFDPGNTIKSVDGVLSCKLCRVSFSGPESALAHLKSKGHLDWLEFKKWKKEKKNLEQQESELDPQASSSSEPIGNKFSTDKEPLEIIDATTKDNESETLQARIAYKKYKEILNESKTIE